MEIIRNHRAVLIIESLLLFVLGSLAISLPIVMSLNVALLLGILFIIYGVYLILRTIVWKHFVGGWVPTLVNLIAHIVIGALLIGLPLSGHLELTWFVCALFIFDGVTKIIIGGLTEAKEWFTFSGMLPLFFAISIWVAFSEKSVWIDGVFVGVNMLFFGVALLCCVFVSSLKKE